ncbi:MAG: hypothetical protein ACETWK_13985 [Candidatus Aminicenantaceae bacterium]
MRNKDILDSWKAISQYLDRDIRTCYRWEKEFHLPIYRIDSESSRSKVFAYKSEIDQWLRERANYKELNKKSLLENRWIVTGLISVLIISLVILSFLYFFSTREIKHYSGNLSIAVLPFKSLNSAEYDEYVSEGITSEIINNLAMNNSLKVIPRDSVNKYKNTIKNPKQIGKELKVNYILKGEIEKQNNKIKVTSQFIRTKDEANIWDAEFDEPFKNITYIEEYICLKICKILNLAKINPFKNPQSYEAYDSYLKGNYVLNRLLEENDDPWKLYHQGRYYWGECTPESNELAINLFSQVIKIDSNYALAYIGLAHCYTNFVNFNWDFDLKWVNKAEDLIKKAQQLSPNLPEYYSTLVEIYLLKDICFNKDTKNIAFELAQEGIKKYPNHPQLNSIVGYCNLLRFGEEGDKSYFGKALEYKEKSFLLNPYSLSNIVYAELLMINKEFYKAIEVCNLIKKHDSSLLVNFLLGEIYYYFQDLEKSKSIFQQFTTPLEYKMGSLLYLGMIASQKGETEETQRIIQEINLLSSGEYISFSKNLKLASIYMAIGKSELGYRHLNLFFKNIRAKKMLYVYHKYIDVDKNFDKFKNEERFKKIIKNKEAS